MKHFLILRVLSVALWLLLGWTSVNPVALGLKPPDPEKVPKSHFLESKLANTKLGPQLEHVRTKRDREETVTDLETAQADTAAAAIEAEHAKDNAIKALTQNAHLEKTFAVEKASVNGKNQGQNLPSQESISNDKGSPTSPDEDYYEDEDEAQETIVEDNDGNITATFIIMDQDRKKATESQPSTRPVEIAVTPRPSILPEGGTCKGLVDLTTMTDDFRKRLQLLLNQEQQAVDRLNKLHNSMQNTAQKLKKVALQQKNYGTANAEPSKACVYISEHTSSQNSQAPEFQTESEAKVSNSGKSQGKLHIYTSQGIFPKANSERVLPSSSSQSVREQQQYLPIMQGHVNSDSNMRFNQELPTASDSNSHRVQRKEASASSAAPSENSGHADVDLENIYWIKPDDATTSTPKNSNTPQVLDQVMKMLRSQGKDVLIIPISSKFDAVKDVANSFLEAVKARKNIRKVQKKLRMKIRRIR